MWNGATWEYCNGKRCTVCRKNNLLQLQSEDG